LHNLYTLRGTKVRDAIKWSNYINEAMHLFAEAEVYFGSHHWPTWGKDNIQLFLQQQRDTYKFIHDQTVRMFNQGMTPNEIAEAIELPESLQTQFSNRDYYGTVKHNAKAVYQAYLGWYDAIPSRLNALPPEESAKNYVKLAGGLQQLLNQAQQSFDNAEYRWTAELLQHAVFAEPKNQEAKELLAKTYDQLGYQSESGPWRNVYLSAAFELRHGGPDKGVDMAQLKDILLQTPSEYFFASMAVRLKGEDADGIQRTIKVHITDLNEYHLLTLDNSVLHHQFSNSATRADATLNVTKATYVDMILGEVGLKEILFSDEVKVDGSTLDLLGFFRLFDKPQGTFNVVLP
jgi:alkyl sulfatase BDS1-like metallo-beta-lactamase superfamily hydrolase